MMMTRSVLVFVILSAWSIRQSESSSSFNRSLCSDASVASSRGIGSEVVPINKWPWLVAFSNKTDNKFFCDGSLISERFVLTAAHCVQPKNIAEPLWPNDVNIYLGKWNLFDDTEPNAVLVTPEEFIIHADWDVSDTRWDADIAIVKLVNDVTLSRSVQPVCFWTSEMQPDKDGDGGTVVGWRRTENQSEGKHSKVPVVVKLKILPISDCKENVQLGQIISDRGMCVGGNRSGPCNDDSSGGLFSPHLGKWFLRGITSTSFFNVRDECDVNAPAVFTNVEKFTSWIDQVLDGDEQIQCRFIAHDSYKCICQNSFTRRDTKIFQVSGSHFGGRTNADVSEFASYDNANLKFLPITLGRFFPNLKEYQVENSGVEKISRKNFVDLPKLKHLRISSCRLKVIPVDAFYDLVNLETLTLWENQITAIDSSTFIRNTKLQEIKLQNNRITSLDSSMFRNNLELIEINVAHNLVSSISPELLTPLTKIQFVRLRNNTCIDKDWEGSPSFSPSKKIEIKETFASQCQ